MKVGTLISSSAFSRLIPNDFALSSRSGRFSFVILLNRGLVTLGIGKTFLEDFNLLLKAKAGVGQSLGKGDHPMFGELEFGLEALVLGLQEYNLLK